MKPVAAGKSPKLATKLPTKEMSTDSAKLAPRPSLLLSSPCGTVCAKPPSMNPENQSWFYAKDDEQHGPIPFLQIKNMVASGQLGAEDLVWNESLNDWIPFQEISSNVNASPASGTLPTQSEPLPIPADLKRASFLKLIILAAVGFILLVGMGFTLVFTIGGTGGPFDGVLAPLSVILGIAALGVVIWGLVLAMIYLHRAWRMLQAFSASITPGIAVGLLFIPVFTLYWHFRSFLNWSREYNDTVARHPDLQMAPRATEGVFMAFCICTLLDGLCGILGLFEPMFDSIGNFFGLGVLICSVAVFYQICNAINFFIEIRDRQAMERQAGM